MLTILTVVSLLGLFEPPHPTDTVTPELVKAFTLYRHSYTGGSYKDEPFAYQLFEPVSRAKNAKFPLIIWLHGSGDIELNRPEIGHLLHILLIIEEPTHPEQYPFYLLAMQMKQREWYKKHWVPTNGETGDPDEQLTVLMKIIEQVISHRHIDRDRVYLTGVSSGGSGCWELAMRFPDHFAAVAPMASGEVDISNASRLVNVPLWAFHSREDKMASPEPIRTMVDAVRKAGGNAYITETGHTGAAASHNCWVTAFEDYDLLDWLLAQRRGTAVVEPPSEVLVLFRKVIRSKTFLVVVVGAALLGIAFWMDRRRKRAQDRANAPIAAEVPLSAN